MIYAEPLTVAGFAPFGSVIEADPAVARQINGGFTTRFHGLARVESDAEVILSIFRGRVRPLKVAMVERHPLGTQAFMPLNGRDWLVVVAERPETSALRAFRCRGDQGVQYGVGVWHHPLLILGEPQDFLVVDRDGVGANLEEVFFPVAVEIQFSE